MSSITMPADSTQSELKRRLKHKTKPMRSASHKRDDDSLASKPKRPKNSGNIVKKNRKGRSYSSDKTDDSCSDRESDLDLSKELLPISGYINSSERMVEHMFHSISMKKLRAMLPEILKPINVSELKSLCMQQLEGMSKKRVSRLLDGDDPEAISSSGTEDECIDSMPTQGAGASVKHDILTETVTTADTSENISAVGSEIKSMEILPLTSLLTSEESEHRAECSKTVVNKELTAPGIESSPDGKQTTKAVQRSSTWDLNDDDQELDYMEDVEEEPERPCDGSETPSSLPDLDSEPVDTCSPLIFPMLERKTKRSAEREIPATSTSELATSTVTTAADNQDEGVHTTLAAQQQIAEEQHAFACAENENNINVENEINVPGDNDQNRQQRVTDVTAENAENEDPHEADAVKTSPDTSSGVVDLPAPVLDDPLENGEGLCSPERDVGIVLGTVKSASTNDGAEMLIDVPDHEFSDEDSSATKLKRRSVRSNSPCSSGRTSSQRISSIVERPHTSRAHSRDRGRRERDSDGHRRYGRDAESNRDSNVSAGKRQNIGHYPSDVRSKTSRQDTRPLSRHRSSETSRRRSLSPKFRSHLTVRRSRSRSRSPFRSRRPSERHSGGPDLHSPTRRDVVIHSPRRNSLSVTISNEPFTGSAEAEIADDAGCLRVRSPKAGSHSARKSPYSRHSTSRSSGSDQVVSSKTKTGSHEKTSSSPSKDHCADARKHASDVLDSVKPDVGKADKANVDEQLKFSQQIKCHKDAVVASKSVEENKIDSKHDRSTSARDKCGKKSSRDDQVETPGSHDNASCNKLLSKSARENLPHDLSLANVQQSKSAEVPVDAESRSPPKSEATLANVAEHHSEVKKLPIVEDVNSSTAEADELKKKLQRSQENSQLAQFTTSFTNIPRASRSLSEPRTLLPTLSAKTLASASSKPLTAEMSPATDTKAVGEITSSHEANIEIATSHDDEKTDSEESQSSDHDREQSESSDAATLSKTQLEILELEMRARAIKAMLRAQEELEESEQQRLEMRRKSSEQSGSSRQQDGGTPPALKLKPLSSVTVQPREVILQKSGSKSRGLVQRAEVVARRKRLSDAREQLSTTQQADRQPTARQSIQLKSSVSPAPAQRRVVRNSSKDDQPARVIRISPIRMERQLDTEPHRSVASAVVPRRSFGHVAVNADSDQDDSQCRVVLSSGMQRVVQITQSSSGQDRFVGPRSSGRNRFRRSRRGYRR